jgi:hypothetical protein
VWKGKYYILHFSMDYQGTFQECEKVNIISYNSAWIIRECGKVNIIFYTSAWIIREHFKSVKRSILYPTLQHGLSGYISRVWNGKYYILHFSMDYQGTFQECGKVNIISYTSAWIIREHFKSVER